MGQRAMALGQIVHMGRSRTTRDDLGRPGLTFDDLRRPGTTWDEKWYDLKRSGTSENNLRRTGMNTNKSISVNPIDSTPDQIISNEIQKKAQHARPEATKARRRETRAR